MHARGALRINQLVIFRYFEDAAARAHQFHVGAWEFLFDPRLQLESPGSVPSGITIFDTYMHQHLLRRGAGYE